MKWTITLCEHNFELELRWFNLSLLLVPIILTLTFIFEDQHSLIYAPISCGVSAMIVFFNFPTLVVALHSRPIYYDDLKLKNYNEEDILPIYDDEFSKKYQRIFRWCSTVTSSVMIGITVELWYFKDQFQTGGDKGVVSSLAVLGIIGGIFRLYYSTVTIIGRLIIFILKLLKKRDQERLRRIANQRTLVQLGSMGIEMGDDKDDEALIIPRTASCHDFSGITLKDRAKVMGMVDLFNDSA